MLMAVTLMEINLLSNCEFACVFVCSFLLVSYLYQQTVSSLLPATLVASIFRSPFDLFSCSWFMWCCR